MIAIDTNIIIRVIVEDDAQQVSLAKDLMASNICYVSRSVVQEVVWVLKKSYKASHEQIACVIDKLIATERMVLEDQAAIEQAVMWYRGGMDFADALHLASNVGGGLLYTFDKRFANKC